MAEGFASLSPAVFDSRSLVLEGGTDAEDRVARGPDGAALVPLPRSLSVFVPASLPSRAGDAGAVLQNISLSAARRDPRTDLDSEAIVAVRADRCSSSFCLRSLGSDADAVPLDFSPFVALASAAGAARGAFGTSFEVAADADAVAFADAKDCTGFSCDLSHRQKRRLTPENAICVTYGLVSCLFFS